MFIPIHQNSTLSVSVPDQDLTLFVKPVTGENEQVLINKCVAEQEKPAADQASKEAFNNDIFNFFVKGYRCSDEKKTTHMFTENETPVEWFNQEILNWFIANVWIINTLGTEEKKS